MLACFEGDERLVQSPAGQCVEHCAELSRRMTRRWKALASRSAIVRLLMGSVLAMALPLAPARAANDAWTFSLSPYLWIAGISGTVGGTASSAPPREIKISFGELFDNLSGIGVMLAGEASYGRFHLVGDLMWLTVAADIKTKGLLFNGGHAKTSVTQAELLGLYRFVKMGPYALDGGAGLRLWSLDLEARLNGGILPTAKADITKTWVDPIFGLRALIRFSPSWSAALYGDIGGFGVSSDFTWQALATLNYRAADWVDLRAGYRHMEVDRSRAHLSLSGPIVAARFRF